MLSKGVIAKNQHSVSELLGVNLMDKYHKYWRLSTVIGQSKKVMFMAIKENISNKLSTWKQKWLSKVENLTLIKVATQVIPTCIMSSFVFLTTFCIEIQQTFANFWWGRKNSYRELHWCKWGKVCDKEGGLGLRDMGCFNKAMIAKCCRLAMQNHSLVEILLKAKYHPRDPWSQQ